jgi:hypothetical protein
MEIDFDSWSLLAEIVRRNFRPALKEHHIALLWPPLKEKIPANTHDEINLDLSWVG